jgi:hypothetical protein
MPLSRAVALAVAMPLTNVHRTDQDLICEDLFTLHGYDNGAEVIDYIEDSPLSPAEKRYWVETFGLQPATEYRR